MSVKLLSDENINRLEGVSTIVTLTAVWLLSEKHYFEGWVINGIGDILWAYWGYLVKAYYLIALQVILFMVCLNGLWNL